MSTFSELGGGGVREVRDRRGVRSVLEPASAVRRGGGETTKGSAGDCSRLNDSLSDDAVDSSVGLGVGGEVEDGDEEEGDCV